jgi:hypothetical protein
MAYKKIPESKLSFFTILLFIFYQAAAAICTFIILFLQGRPSMINASYWEKLLYNEFWTVVEWLFALPAIRLGVEFMSMPQIILVAYLVGFIVQIFVDKYWIIVPIYLDTYICMIIMMFALVVANLKLLG